MESSDLKLSFLLWGILFYPCREEELPVLNHYINVTSLTNNQPPIDTRDISQKCPFIKMLHVSSYK